MNNYEAPRLAPTIRTASTAVCFRCGIELSDYKADLIKSGSSRLCNDCKPVKRNMGDGRCNPWMGEVDDDFNPMTKEGKLYLPGLRTCGHKDCVRKAHIVPFVAEPEVIPEPEVKLPSNKPVKPSRKPRQVKEVVITTSAIETTFEQELEAERHDLSYRTGVRLTYEELVQSVQRERYKPRAK